MLSHGWRIILAWLSLCVLLSVFLFGAGDAALRTDIAESLRQHLLVTLDDANFSSTGDRINDEEALLQAGQGLNAALVGVVQSRWFAPYQSCQVRVIDIDGVVIEPGPDAREIRLRLPRNQVQREVRLGLTCQPRLPLVIGGWALLGALFAGLYWLLPPPLSREHRYWSGFMLGRGYDEDSALEIVTGYSADALSLSDGQRHCLERLHDETRGNFPQVLAVVCDHRVAALAEEQLDWLLLGLGGSPVGDLDAALVLAAAPDEVCIDLNERRLRVHGVDIPVGTTPLLYYAWYAQRRCDGDGWVSNPAANRPDPQAGADLLALMSAHGGHARAINDLDQAGLKARTLDQNRSKIKEEMVAVLGETLASAYLFEARKDEDGLQTQYRLCPEKARLRIIF